ncbi:DUF3231 family protein [Ferdinandcohnia quinoae]|uniref:DUF3231 family protein n=1 Tax=Fredinandcohnia quinoae TaxID=2918902 RepID=A0AAW5E6K8_9BACI|nr:DUF3231 family protein [Fredinandcohnia sp. SECRCQ15]MCH1625611.1 DUF3231 family protein [Fredinandcohnia sp. SECRCQ15]
MEEQHIRLSSPEIGGLWSTYMQDSMTVCLLKYFLHHMQDNDIKPLLKKALNQTCFQLKQIEEIFLKEKIPIPDGFSDKDINLSAPPLFYDLFALTLLYSMSRMNMVNLSFITANVAREDVRIFFTNALKFSAEQYSEATSLMLEKGIYDRPPMIPYPSNVEYIEKQTYIFKSFGGKRPLNAIELTDIFFNVERNYFAVILCTGLLQVVKDKEITEYIKDGKQISEKQIKFINDLLMKEDLLGTVPLTMEVTKSTVSPFSDKFIVALFHSLNSIDITLIGHALSLSLRTDLATFYSKMIAEILLYAERGFTIMVNRKWLEQPPQSIDRQKLQQGHSN